MDPRLITSGGCVCNNNSKLWLIIVFLFIMWCFTMMFWHYDKKEKLKLRQDKERLLKWKREHKYGKEIF